MHIQTQLSLYNTKILPLTMTLKYSLLTFSSFFSLLIISPHSTVAAPIGVCYGRIGSNLPPTSEAVNLIKSNGITRVRLFNADPDALRPFSGSGIELIIGVPNEVLPILAAGTVATSIDWLQSNIFSNISTSQVRYIAVGNEVFLQSPYYTQHILPAMLNLYGALQRLGLAETVKLSSALAASTLTNSYPPSAGTFDPNLGSVMVPLLLFLRNTNSALMVNVYPYFSYIGNPYHVSLDYTLFRSNAIEHDQNLVYDNMFDATVDAFIYAMEREGFRGVPVVVTETGWPTAGGGGASVDNALAYNDHIVRRTLNDVGTPKRPGIGVEVFIFDLFDENGKDGQEFEKHFGIFGVNGVKAYDLNFN